MVLHPGKVPTAGVLAQTHFRHTDHLEKHSVMVVAADMEKNLADCYRMVRLPDMEKNLADCYCMFRAPGVDRKKDSCPADQKMVPAVVEHQSSSAQVIETADMERR
jgi:hypothetical protein